MTLVFHEGVNSIRANKWSAPVPTRCLLFLVTNGNLTLVFRMEVHSIRAYKLSAIVSRILNKNETFIPKLFLPLCSSSSFQSDILKVKSMRTVQMFFEDCVMSN